MAGIPGGRTYGHSTVGAERTPPGRGRFFAVALNMLTSGAEPQRAHGAERNTRVVAGGRMDVRWVDGWAAGVLCCKCVARWLVCGWMGWWRGGAGGGLCAELQHIPECAALSQNQRTAPSRTYECI